MIKKYLLGVALALPTLASTGVALAKSGDSLQDLQDQCIRYRNNRQMKAPNIKLLCNTSFEQVTRRDAQLTLSNGGELSAQITMKGWQTAENVFEIEADASVAQCSIYEKSRITGPEGGVPVSITACEDLNEQYVTNLCKEITRDICTSGTIINKQQNGSQQQQEQGASCVREVVETINTCDNYLPR